MQDLNHDSFAFFSFSSNLITKFTNIFTEIFKPITLLTSSVHGLFSLNKKQVNKMSSFKLVKIEFHLMVVASGSKDI